MTTWNFTISQDLKRKDINIVEDTVSNAYETVLYLNRTRGHEDHESEPDKEVRVFIHLSVKDSYEKVFCFEHKPVFEEAYIPKPPTYETREDFHKQFQVDEDFPQSWYHKLGMAFFRNMLRDDFFTRAKYNVTLPIPYLGQLETTFKNQITKPTNPLILEPTTQILKPVVFYDTIVGSEDSILFGSEYDSFFKKVSAECNPKTPAA
jgi:hypothetical protein